MNQRRSSELLRLIPNEDYGNLPESSVSDSLDQIQHPTESTCTVFFQRFRGPCNPSITHTIIECLIS